VRPSPVTGLLAMAGWAALGSVLLPVLLPPIPLYRTVIAGAALLLFALAVATPRAAFVLATASLAGAGVSALVAGSPEPAFAGPILACGLLSGSALRRVYEVGAAPPVAPILPLWRGLAVASTLSAGAAVLGLRTSYLLIRSVPPPRVVNVLGDDVAQALLGVVSVLAALAVAAGFHCAAAFLGRDLAGRRAIDAALVFSALVAGGVALLQKLELVPLWRAARWQDWGRVQGTFTDPSAAGVGVALLIAPLLAAASTGPALARIAAGAGVPLLVSLLADAGSRAGFVGTLTAASLFVLFALTRLAAGERPGARRRLASTVGGLAILSALAFAAALSWPGRGAVRSALLQRLAAPFEKKVATPSERSSNRVLLYEGAFALFREHPVAGSGLGTFRSEFPNVARNVLLRPVSTTDHPPSLYLGTLAESGLAGAALLLLIMLATVRGIARAFSLGEAEPEEALRAAGAAAAMTGLLVVFLFGSHLVYPEIAALAGVLTARLPLRREGRTSRVLASVGPLVLAGSLVLLAGGLVARAIESSTPDAAFAHERTAGLYPVEREPDGRVFRWSGPSAALRVVAERSDVRPGTPALLSVAVRNARPDARPVSLSVSWNDRFRGRVALPRGGWYRLELATAGSGVLLLRVDPPFRPPGGDQRLLGIEVGAAALRPAPR